MINKVTKTVAIAALAGVGMFGLSACSNSTPVPPINQESTIVPETPVSTPSSSASAGVQVIAPITVNMTEINNTTQSLKVGEVLNLNVADQDPSVWSGVSSDPASATVTEGSDSNGVRMNPGVTGTKEGTSTVTFTNSFSKEVVTFTVVVTAK